MNDPALIEQAALAGFDFCIIDMEHGPISFESAQNLIRAAELHGMSPIIRTTDTSDENTFVRSIWERMAWKFHK